MSDKKPINRVFKTSVPKLGDLITDLSPDLKLTINIDEEEKLWVAEIGEAIAKKVQETSDKVDYRWRVTQWLIAVGMALNAISFLVTN